MAEKPEDLNLPNAVISRLAKDAVRLLTLNIIMWDISSRNYFAKIWK